MDDVGPRGEREREREIRVLERIESGIPDDGKQSGSKPFCTV